jgi:phosphocarrier protein HPr
VTQQEHAKHERTVMEFAAKCPEMRADDSYGLQRWRCVMSEESNQSRGWCEEPESATSPSAPAGHQGGGRRHGAGELSDPTRVTAQFTIVNGRGLHVRAAAKLVLVASRFPCDVVVRRDGVSATAKSVMEILLLRAFRGTTVEVVAAGHGARDCVDAIGELVRGGFGDPG